LMEVASAFGPIKAYHFKDNAHPDSPCAFVEYADQSVAVKACAGLNALEATTRTAGSKATDQSGAAAIQVTEVRATGSTLFITGEVAAQAQSAATLNTSTRDEDKVTLSVVVTVSVHGHLC
ncbi:late embryogenesis abundant protein D-34-like protein, partial [Tanacetum coccineum]